MTFKLKLLGIGGQGIVFMGWILGYAINLEGKYVALRQSYGSEVRGTPVYADLVFSEKPIECPYTKEYDLIIALHQKAINAYSDVFSPSTTVIADDTLVTNVPGNVRNVEFKSFLRTCEKENVRALNMVVLGYLAKKNIVKLDSLMKAVETSGRNVEENKRALQIGYNM